VDEIENGFEYRAAMRVTLVIFSLVAGGAERVMAAMANFWAEKGWIVNLLTLDSGAEPPFYPLHPAVFHQPLALGSKVKSVFEALRANFDRVRRLRAAIRETKPDIVISLMSETNVLTLLAMAGTKVPVLVQEQNDPYHQWIPKAWNILRRWAYPSADHVVVLTERSLSFFSRRVRNRARVIPNPAMVSIPPRQPFSSNGHSKTMIAMGRLVRQKGFDILLQAFARVAGKHPEWSLEILGEGRLREKLEAQVESLGLRDRVRLPGTTKEPHEKLRRADLFVMSSRHEGFPLSLCEALACGLPAISFDCPTGPREIIRDGIDGVLVPPEDADALAGAMSQLMGDAKRRETLAGRAPEVLDRFGIQQVMGIWEALIAETIRERAPRQK
jgi:glycosyltransferase involved in cell wall biosynthesis